MPVLVKTTDYYFNHPLHSMLETFPNPGVSWVCLKQTEHTSLCPITGQPDYGTVEISYVPNKLCLESKSLKLYLMTYRNEGTFCETSCNNIFEDVKKVLRPKTLSVKVTYISRGGITIQSEKVGE